MITAMFNIDSASQCPVCKKTPHGSLKSHLQAKEAVVYVDGAGNFHWYEKSSTGYQFDSSKRLTKNALIKKLRDLSWTQVFPDDKRTGAHPSDGDVTMEDAGRPASAGPSTLGLDTIRNMDVDLADEVGDRCQPAGAHGGENDFGEAVVDLGDPIHIGESEDMLMDDPHALEAPLVQPSPLDSFGLAFNAQVKVLTCTVCLIGLLPSEWMGHLENKHAAALKQLRKKSPTELDSVQAVISGFELGDPAEVRDQMPGRPPVEGIRVHTGYYCTVVVEGSPCSHVTGTLQSFATHLSKMHKDADKRPASCERNRHACDYQTIFDGKYRRYFQVRTGLGQASQAGPYEVFLARFKSTVPHAMQSTELETWGLPSLVRATHWDIFVDPFRKSPEEVVNLVNFPSHQNTAIVDEKVLCRLHNVSKAWLQQIHGIWKGSSQGVRRMLNIVDGTYWKWLETREAEDMYMRTLTRFIAACVRSKGRGDGRCKLPLNPDQLALVGEMQDCIHHLPNTPRVDELVDPVLHLQKLFFSLVTNTATTNADNQFSCPVQCFIAACSYNNDDTFKSPNNMTSMLAHWQFILRATGLYAAHLSMAQDSRTSILQKLQVHCPQHLSESHASVFDSVRQLQRLVSTLAFNQLVAPTTVWNHDMSIVQFRSVHVHIRKLLDGVQSMVQSLRSKLYSFTDGKPIKCHIPADIADDLTSTSRGDSWMSSAHTLPREQALMHHMTSNGSWRLADIEAGELKWNKLACAEFMCRTAQIVELIATLVHIGAGPPCRGTEQMADQVVNGIQPRTLYLSFGQLLTIRRHTKNTHASGLDAFNVCYCPKVLTELITYYLLVVRPLERVLAEVLYDSDAVGHYDMHLYVRHGTQMSSDVFSDVLEKVTREHIGTPLSLNPLRHIMVAFQRAYVEESRIAPGDNIGDLISAHSSKTADSHYAREHGTLEGKTTTYLMDVREWCDMYHDAIGLGTRTGPLIPLRDRRKLARELSSLICSTPGSGLNGAVRSLVEEIQRLTFKSAVDELQPFIRSVIDTCFAEAWTRLLTDVSSSRNLHDPTKSARPHTVQTPRPTPTTGASNTVTPPTDLAQHPPAQTPQHPMEKAATVTRQAKRTLTQVYHGSGAEQETSENKRRSMLEAHHSRHHIPTITTNVGGSPNEAGPSPDLPGDHHQAATDDISGPSTSVLVHQQLITQTADPLEPEGEMPTRRNSPEVDESDRLFSRFSIDDPPQPTARLNALDGLRKILRDDDATFRSNEQERLVNAVLEGVHTLAILPTGGGKSMAFEIPPVVKGALTIVIVPFRSVITQVLRNAARRGIKAELWRISTTRDATETKLIVIAVETATQRAFTDWLGDNCSAVGSVIFDEAHTVITSCNFRQCMHLVPTLMEQKVAVIFLTATLPVRLEELFRKAVNLPANHNLIRAQTNRPESVYIVKPFQASPPGEGVEQVGARLAAKLAELLEGEDRAIIFVRKKDHGDEIARRLYGCPFISSDMTDEKARTEAMKQWENGTTGGLLVGTSSLIQGLHYDHVRYVIFVGAPWGLIDLVQGAGRGGRDGKRAEVVVINCFDKSPNDPTPDDPQCEGEMGRWLIAQHCRRELISSTMDAVQVTCQSLEGALPCDNCQSRHPEVDNAWAYATSATTSATSKNTSLSAPPHTLQQQEDTTQLALPTLRPQAPKAQVIDHSVITTADRELLHSRTRSVFNSIVATSPTCAICWFLNLRDGRLEQPAERHATVANCARYRQKKIEGFGQFYDFSNPKKQQAQWSYDSASYTKWCFFCGFPTDLHDAKDFGPGCPANGFTLGLAWAVFIDNRIHDEVGKYLGCGSNVWENGNSWFSFLATKNEAAVMYNLHRLAVWFFEFAGGKHGNATLDV